MYKEFQNVAQIDGIWDDHDMGVNDGGKHVAFKEERRDLFMKYIGDNNRNALAAMHVALHLLLLRALPIIAVKKSLNLTLIQLMRIRK